MSISVRIVVVLAMVAAANRLAAPLVAQSLGNIAKQEEERRKAIKAPSKVLTNKDLPNVPPPTPPSAATPSSAADAGKAEGDKNDKATSPTDGGKETAAPAAATATDGSEKKTEAKDQAYWSGRLQALQTQLGRDQTYADALQTRINVLNADFVNRDDPVQRAAVNVDRQKALEELGRLNKQIADDRKALADLEEDARRAGVPPGWLR